LRDAAHSLYQIRASSSGVKSSQQSTLNNHSVFRLTVNSQQSTVNSQHSTITDGATGIDITAETPSMLVSPQGFSRVQESQRMFVCMPSSQRKDLLPPPVQLCDSVMQVCGVLAFLRETINRKQRLAQLSRLVQGLEQRPSARMGKKAENLFEFLFTVNISSGRKRVSSLADSLVTMTNLLPNLLPIATNTQILGEPNRNPNTPAMPQIPKSA
jgi:hypothetical protein